MTFPLAPFAPGRKAPFPFGNSFITPPPPPPPAAIPVPARRGSSSIFPGRAPFPPSPPSGPAPFPPREVVSEI